MAFAVTYGNDLPTIARERHGSTEGNEVTAGIFQPPPGSLN
jgi:hypothetical protein